MLSKTECKKILNKRGVHYEDHEIELVRNVLYKVAETCRLKITQTKTTINEQQQTTN